MQRPGGPLASRPLHCIFMVDRSGSMDTGGKIQSLNTGVREALPHMRRVAHENPNAQVLIRVLAFSTGAEWVVPEPTPVEQFTWTDLVAGGVTDLGRALSMVAEVLRVPPMSTRALQPVLILASDGHATDPTEEGMARLLAEPWGQKAIKVAIAIGRDADLDVLQRFIGDPRRPPLTAYNSAELVDAIRWVSTTPVQLASAPPVGQTAADVVPPVHVPYGAKPTADITATPW